MNELRTNAEPSLDPAAAFQGIRFEHLKSIVVAVSGGSDSLALLSLVVDLKKSTPDFPKIVVVTIDHHLRPESTDEARYVAILCRKAGLDHRTLDWAGPKPAGGLSAKARQARYALLCQAAREAGTDVILTGHTLDDQIETFVMRAARVPGGGNDRGLAAMAPMTLLDREIWLIRPLLGTTRQALRRFLTARGVAWRDDPSNEDPRYERVRVRRALQGWNRASILDDLAQKISLRQRLNMHAARLLLECATVQAGICAEVRHAPWVLADEDTQRLAMGVLLATMGGQAFLPAHSICDKALAFVRGGDSQQRLSLSRCLVESDASKFSIYREMRSLPAGSVAPGGSTIWDGRYCVTNRGEKLATITARGTRAGDPSRKSPAPRGLHSSPAVWLGETLFAGVENHGKLPSQIELARHLALFDHVLSGYDLYLAQSVAAIFQAPDYKHPPVNQINKN